MQIASYVFNSPEQLEQWLNHYQSTYQAGELLVQLQAACDAPLASRFAELVSQYLPGATVIGMSATRIIVNGRVQAHRHLISISCFHSTQIKSDLIELSGEFEQDGERLFGALTGPQCQAIVAFADGITALDQRLFSSLNRDGCTLPVNGGIADPTDVGFDAWVLLNDRVMSNAIVAVALHSSNLQVWFDTFVEWLPIGPELTVTAVTERRLYQLNQRPAFELYREYLAQGATLPFGQAQDFPLLGCWQGCDQIAAPDQLLPDDSLLLTETLHEGQHVRFGYSHPQLTLSRVSQAAQQLRQQQPEAIYTYNCLARSTLAIGEPELELGPLGQVAAMVGSYCYGEFNREQGLQRILHHSLTYLALREGDGAEMPEGGYGYEAPQTHYSLKPLFNLVERSLGELDERTRQLQALVQNKSNALLHSAHTDQLTNLPNRQALREALRHDDLIEQIAVLKLNNLTQINQLFGCDAGDQVLTEVSQLLRTRAEALFGSHCTLYKGATSEWVIAVDQSVSASRFYDAILQLLTQCEATEFNPGAIEAVPCLNVTMAAGIASRAHLAAGATDPDLLVQLAVAARRHSARLNLRVATAKELQQEKDTVARHLLWLNRVHHALDEERIRVFAQPICAAGSRQPVAMECLLRLVDEQGVHAPGLFLPAVQDTHLYAELSRHMIARSIGLLDQQSLSYSINLAPQDIFNDTTVQFIEQQLRCATQPQLIGFEVVETEPIRDYGRFREVLAQFRALGARIIIDDFGAGYSNLEKLLQLDPAVLKIDGSLVREIDHNRRHQRLFANLVGLCRELEIETVAEFVASQAICDQVEALGVDYLQGFFLGKPQPL